LAIYVGRGEARVSYEIKITGHQKSIYTRHEPFQPNLNAGGKLIPLFDMLQLFCDLYD